jgi:hypothetical protein
MMSTNEQTSSSPSSDQLSNEGHAPSGVVIAEPEPSSGVVDFQLMESSDNEHEHERSGSENDAGNVDRFGLAFMTQPDNSLYDKENSESHETDYSGKSQQPAECDQELSKTDISRLSPSVHEVAPPPPQSVVESSLRSSPSSTIKSSIIETSLSSGSGPTKDNDEQHIGASDKSAIVDFDTQNSIMYESDDESKRRQRFLHKMEMKKQAIYRSSLHLCDNSFSFIYNESNSTAMNNDDEPGLPFIGPDLKEQYDTLRTLLRKGLLGSTHDEDDDYTTLNSMDGSNEKTLQPAGSNPFLPQIKSNVSAVLMGPRGHGKSLVLERCLASLSRLAKKRKDRIFDHMMRNQQVKLAEEMYSQASFRVVRLNGLLFQGDSAVACTQEIARQIGVMSREERRRTRKIVRQLGVKRNRSEFQDVKTPKSSSREKRKKDKSAKYSCDKMLASASSANASATKNDESHDLRIRRSGFNTYISLLDEVLRSAQIDGIPILIVLEELDTFLAGGRSSSAHNAPEISDSGNPQHDGGSSDRQLLLYHLLDRVADHKFLVSFVGMTTELTAVTRLEKRVQSRAEGTSKLIYFGHNKDYDDLVKCVIGKFYTPPASCDSDVDEYNEQHAMLEIREDVETILRGGGKLDGNLDNSDEDDDEINDFTLIQRVFQRNYNLKGSDMRWVCRVFEVALGLLASGIDERIHHCIESNSDDPQSQEEYVSTPKLTPSHVAQALAIMSASLDDISDSIGPPGIPTRSTLELIRWGQLIGDPNHYSCLVGTHSRLLALLGLSGPQVAVLLAARRIEARDGSAEGNKQPKSLPLTYQRIQDEYATSFVASGRYTISSDRYPLHVLHRSCTELMELGIICLKKQMCGGGALQYGHNDVLCCGSDISNLPLHVNVEWDLEFVSILKAGLLQCSTALREWGMKIS